MQTCKFNLMVICETQDKCLTCGWNPEVLEARKKAAREQLKKGVKDENRRIQQGRQGTTLDL